MASVRGFKKDVDYLIQELLSDCYLTLALHPEKKDKAIEIMEQAIALRNALYEKINNFEEKKNGSLLKKHFQHLRAQMFETVDALFKELSVLNK